MSVPDLSRIVHRIRAEHPAAFPTKADLCRYSHAVIVALHAADPNFGKLSKSPGQNHCPDPSGQLGAVDVALYKPTGQIIDFIVSAGFGSGPRPPDIGPDEPWPPANEVAWGVGPEGEYGPDRWFAPAGAAPPAPGPTPPGPTPPSPPAPSGDLAAVLLLVQDISVRVTQMQTTINAMHAKAPPTYAGSLFGYTLTLSPQGPKVKDA